MTKADTMGENSQRAPFQDISIEEGDRGGKGGASLGQQPEGMTADLWAGALGDCRSTLTEKGQQGTMQRERTLSQRKKSQAGKTWRGRVTSMTSLASGEARGPASVRSGPRTAVGERDGVDRSCHRDAEHGKARHRVSVASLIVSVWLEDSHTCYASSPAHIPKGVYAQPQRAHNSHPPALVKAQPW